jgi:hypothetical protein
MSPQRKGSRRGSDWKPPRDRRELAIAVMASLAVIVVTAALVWFLRPNRDSESSPDVDLTPASTTVASDTTTTLPPDITVAPTTLAPTTSSTP